MSSITLCINSLWDEVDMAAAAIRGLCAPLPLLAEQVDEIELSVVETLNNIVKHAYSEQPGKRIEIIWSLQNDTLEIAIMNWGKPIKRNPPSDLPAADSENGRGWYIIKSCVDRFAYYTEQDGTNVIKLVKQLA